jgi:hypothetical protein
MAKKKEPIESEDKEDPKADIGEPLPAQDRAGPPRLYHGFPLREGGRKA